MADYSDALAVALWSACRQASSTRELALSSVGRTALSVGIPLKGMQREMAMMKAGLAIGAISPVNLDGTLKRLGDASQ